MRLLIGSILLIAPIALQGQTASKYTIAAFAGTGVSGYSGDTGAATTAQLAIPYGLVVNASGAVFICDQANHRIREVTGGVISTVAGNGTKGYSGDGGAATSATIASPGGIALDSSGAIYFSDTGNQVVRKFTTSGNISPVAGNNIGGAGYSGDGQPATNATLNTPIGIAIDSAGNLYIADKSNNRIRRVSAAGTISTIAGGNAAGFTGDGGPANLASLRAPSGVALDASGNIYIADTGNQRIRKITTDGRIATIAGNGAGGFSGDLGRATSASLNSPASIAVDTSGNVYIADTSNSRIRRVSPTGTITTIAGNGRFAYSGDGGDATSASLSFPGAVAVDSKGNVYVADTQNNVVRVLAPVADSASPPVVMSAIGAGGFGGSSTVAPGSWIEIYGSNLSVTTRSWAGSDFTGTAAPLALDGVSVSIGGQPAVLSYISGGQVNALVPAGLGSGDQPLVVSTIVGSSAAYTIQVDPTQPALYAPPVFNVQGKQYVGAVLIDGSGYALPTGAVAGVASRPAQPGETIALFGMGFGPVLPDIPYGQIAQQNNAITGSLQIFFGDSPATVSYGGLAPSSVGLYQFNVTVPSGTAGGDVPLTFTFAGVKSRQSLFISVQNASAVSQGPGAAVTVP